MPWYHPTIENQWTQPAGTRRDADRQHWQVAFADADGLLLLGCFDHVIESHTHIRNLHAVPIVERVWPQLVLDLSEALPVLAGPDGPVERSPEGVTRGLGRWGRAPDDAADVLLLLRGGDPPEDWSRGLRNPAARLGVHLSAVRALLVKRERALVWALDGHLYGAFLGVGEAAVRAKLERAEALVGYPAARHQRLRLA